MRPAAQSRTVVPTVPKQLGQLLYSKHQPTLNDTQLAALANHLQTEATALGFSLFGIAPAVTPTGFHRLVDWIDAGYAADMTYFADRLPAYRDLNLVLQDVRSIVVLGFPYRTDKPAECENQQGRIARYAWGSIDYHDLIHPKLRRLKGMIADATVDAQSRGVVDSAPVMEREFAQLAGLGWTGKNSLLLNRQQGSYFFLSCVLTTLSLPTSEPFESDHCGTCQRCIEACPTQAFVSPGVLDSRRCISYQTIENRGVIPPELRAGIGNWVFGCDVCQEVCPWNRFGDQSGEPSLRPGTNSNPIDLLELISLDEAAFRQRFRHTPLWRPRRRGLLRNAAICLGNARDIAAIAPLAKLLTDDEPVIRGAAAWALGMIGDEKCVQALHSRQAAESDDDVCAEIRFAIRQCRSTGC